MKAREFMAKMPVFTLREFREACGTGRTAYNLLVRAAEAGKVERVVRGVYVSNHASARRADPYDIADALAEDAIMAYHSALALNGTAHSASPVIQFFSAVRSSPVCYRSWKFTPFPMPATKPKSTNAPKGSGGRSIRCTTPEQTLVDCLSNVRAALGPEETIRSLAALSFLKADVVARIAEARSQATNSRIGWLLEQKEEEWYVGADTLEAIRGRLGEGPYYFDASCKADGANCSWSKRWRLYLPSPESEVSSWLS